MHSARFAALARTRLRQVEIVGAQHLLNARSALDSELRVLGTANLRVCDASVFPKIPGFFIVSAIYMVSEKATDMILATHGKKRRLNAAVWHDHFDD